MGIKRYLATKDTTITDAYKPLSNTVRATGSNMGAADSLEVFALFGNFSSGSVEKSRILLEFPVSDIALDRSSNILPASGSVDFYMKLCNVAHHETLPKNFVLVASPISASWDEGHGLDLDNYSDLGAGHQGLGANWEYRVTDSSGLSSWDTLGGDFHSTPVFSQSFVDGPEDLEILITPIVEEWIAGTKSNNGIALHLTSSQENALSSSVSYFTKKFSARTSEYWFNRPVIEARWNSSKKDHRGVFHVSSSALSANDNLNTIYLYNFHRGQLTNLPVGTGSIYVTLHTSGTNGEALTATPNNPVTGGYVSTGIYSASFALATTASVFYDRWFSGSTYYHTGSCLVESHNSSNISTLPQYITKIVNLKPKYSRKEVNSRLRVFTREKNWCPTIYTKAINRTQVHIVEDSFWKVIRISDGVDVISYGTGSNSGTLLSYDASGSYFDFDMSLLENDYSYGFKFTHYLNGTYVEQPEIFRFRVEE